jgi:hypothetical protein
MINEKAPHDFDFLVGDWHIANRRLSKPLDNRTDWDEFPATLTCRHLIGGVANVDEMFVPERGFNGMSLRTFDLDRQEWSIFWVNDRNGRLDLPPVVGVFTAGVGTFTCDDTYEGAPIRVRYTWSDITPTSAHWDQAFSADGGQTWETNWSMELTRA